MTALDLKSFDSHSALMDACLDVMAGMTDRERGELRTEILRELGLRSMMAIATVALVRRQHAARFREVYGDEGAERILGQLHSEALATIVRVRGEQGHPS